MVEISYIRSCLDPRIYFHEFQITRTDQLPNRYGTPITAVESWISCIASRRVINELLYGDLGQGGLALSSRGRRDASQGFVEALTVSRSSAGHRSKAQGRVSRER
jgi:hypothetical protein